MRVQRENLYYMFGEEAIGTRGGEGKSGGMLFARLRGSSGSRHAMGHSEARKEPTKWIGEILVINSQD